MRFAVDAETAGAIIRPADDGRGPAILRGRNAPERAAGRTGENRKKHRFHGSPQRLGLGEQDNVSGVHRCQDDFIHMVQGRRGLPWLVDMAFRVALARGPARSSRANSLHSVTPANQGLGAAIESWTPIRPCPYP